ncbi:DUF86 domain-containing protein [Chloroflexus sp. Y-396-1]|uniref:type VII toxin-antitoxin system HepT family RNase toxin n=1 Tax=Chloroflexus sp. Y-396-1 TaxID=867845 RepID=UPI001E508273|nr:DUF86 domain-containing protein [Chloroflexus sp. Y-396-1]
MQVSIVSSGCKCPGIGAFRQTYAIQDIRRDPHLEWALRYGLLEAIQIVIDLSCHLVNEKNLGVPSTYAECVDLLRRARILDDHLSNVISGMVGLRNILVHGYISVDPGRIYDLLDRLDDFRLFAKQIHSYISTMPGNSH